MIGTTPLGSADLYLCRRLMDPLTSIPSAPHPVIFENDVTSRTQSAMVDAQASPRQNTSISIVSPAPADEVTVFAIQKQPRYLLEMTGETITHGNASAKHRIFFGELSSGLNLAAAGKLRERFPFLFLAGHPFLRGELC